MYAETWLDPDLALSIAAARLVLPRDALLDGLSALHASGVELGPERPLRFVTAHPHQVRRPGVHVRRVRVLPPTDASGTAVSPATAFVAAGRELGLVDLVVAGYWLLRLELTAWNALVEAAASFRGRHARLVRRAASLVRDRVDSPQETRLRLCLVLAGLPEPEVNPVVTVQGRRIGRVDLLFRRWRVLIEYEGDQHRTDRRQWTIDIDRHERFREGEWSLVRVTGQRMEHPRAVVTQVARELRAGGWDGADPGFEEEWHRLFPSAR